MPWSDLGSLGSNGSSANNQATLTLSTAIDGDAGNFAVLVIADDNRLNGADADGSEVSTITDNSAGGSQPWEKVIGWANNNAAAQAGAAVQIWFAFLDKPMPAARTITITFTSATLSDATAVTGRLFSTTKGGKPSVAATNTLSNDAADPGSLDATTGNAEFLRIRGIAAEVGNNTNLTPTTNWTAWANGNSATTGTTAEQCARAEHHISTGTGDASNPTYVSADCASAYVAFQENAAPWGETFDLDRVKISPLNASEQQYAAFPPAEPVIDSTPFGGVRQIGNQAPRWVGALTHQFSVDINQVAEVTRPILPGDVERPHKAPLQGQQFSVEAFPIEVPAGVRFAARQEYPQYKAPLRDQQFSVEILSVEAPQVRFAAGDFVNTVGRVNVGQQFGGDVVLGSITPPTPIPGKAIVPDRFNVIRKARVID